MVPLVFSTDFKKLRCAYREVHSFIKEETLGTASLKTRIVEDLGCAGDDNYELLEKFVTKYKLDGTGFDYTVHFHSEGELFSSEATFWNLLSLVLRLFTWIIRGLTFGKINWTQIRFFDWDRKTSDMTFGDLLVWYLTGTYNLRQNVQVRLC